MAKEESKPSITGTVDLQGQIAAQRGELERKDAEIARLKALLVEREAELVAHKGTLAASLTVSVPGLEQGEGQFREGVTINHQLGDSTARTWARAGDVVTTKGADRVTRLQEQAGQQIQVFSVSTEMFRLLANHLK